MFQSFFWKILVGSPITLLSTLIVFILSIIYYNVKHERLPPGPWGLPYLGYWPFLRNGNTHLQLEDIKKKYGNVSSFKVTGRLYIHLGSVSAIKEAHVKKADCFKKRFTDFNAINFAYKDGLVCQNGEAWKELRSFFAKVFKQWISSDTYSSTEDLGVSLKHLTEYLGRSQGKSLNVKNLLDATFSDVFRRLNYGNKILPLEDFNAILEAFESVLSRFDGARHLLMGDFAKNVIFPLTPGYRTAVKNYEFVTNTIRNIVNKHNGCIDDCNTRSLIDSFWKERNQRKEKDDPTADYFTEDTLIHSLMQLSIESTVDVSSLMGYVIKYLLEYPKEQEKIYEELVEIVGLNRQPTLGDKAHLLYSNAFLNEVTRKSDFFNFFPSLECTTTTSISGYKIPKGSITLLNMFSAHNNEETFKEPQKFNPSRYLRTGDKKTEEAPVLFGMGKRTCTAQSFTMNLMFLFFATIVYNFKLTPAGEVHDVPIKEITMYACKRQN